MGFLFATKFLLLTTICGPLLLRSGDRTLWLAKPLKIVVGRGSRPNAPRTHPKATRFFSKCFDTPFWRTKFDLVTSDSSSFYLGASLPHACASRSDTRGTHSQPLYQKKASRHVGRRQDSRSGVCFRFWSACQRLCQRLST